MPANGRPIKQSLAEPALVNDGDMVAMWIDAKVRDQRGPDDAPAGQRMERDDGRDQIARPRRKGREEA